MEKSQKLFGIILSFAEALEEMYENMHWKSEGTHYYSDHLLYERLYDDIGDEVDLIAEKALGIFDDPKVIKPAKNVARTAEIFGKYMSDDDAPDDFPTIAIKAEKDFIKLIDKALDIFGSEGVLTAGIEDLFPAIVSKHEEHLYLLQQRNRTKEAGMRPLPRLYKLAYHLDQKGLYNEAQKIEEVMKQLSERVGLTGEDIVALADHFDEIGDTALANYFDGMLEKVAKKKEKKEKLPIGAEHKAPKKWWKEKEKEVKKDNPSYSKEQIAKTIGNIWDNSLSDAERVKIYKEYGKPGNPNK